ncbi:unnamed protein product, partial [Staurois parvus]
MSLLTSLLTTCRAGARPLPVLKAAVLKRAFAYERRPATVYMRWLGGKWL